MGKKKKDHMHADLKIGTTLTVSSLVELQGQVLKLFGKVHSLSLDIGDTTDCDTAGVQFLLSVVRYAQENEKTFKVANPPVLVEEAVRRAGITLNEVFTSDAIGD